MISAHGTPKVPAENSLGIVPGMTTERAGTRPLDICACDPRTSTIDVLAVSTTPAPNTASRSTRTPSTTIEREPTNAPSSMMTGAACGGSSTPPIPTPPERCTFLPICAHDPTVAHVSTIVPSSTYAPILTYDGIMITPGARYAPKRADAPGTTRTPAAW